MIARIDQDDTLPLDQVVHGECLSVMRTFPDNSVDSIVADPPAGISFMNKEFDHHRGGRDLWIAWLAEIMREALRCLKPGGHALIWSLPRTSHWTATALEDAGFEIRDCITHLFGSGFPKSLDIGKAIHKQLGIEREVIGISNQGPSTLSVAYEEGKIGGSGIRQKNYAITAPSPELQQYEGQGSALKPAAEFWWLCRKPLSEKTLALNVLKWNCGGLNIDKSRIPGEWTSWRRKDGTISPKEGYSSPLHMNRDAGKLESVARNPEHPQGRFPSNVLFSHSLFCTDTVCDASCPVLALEQQSGVRKSGGGNKNPKVVSTFNASPGHGRFNNATIGGDTGTASRFYHCFTPDVPFLYCAKSSRSERNLGCEGLEPAQTFDKNTSKRIAHINHETGNTTYNDYIPSSNQNTHPTVKPQNLLRYLISMITPDNGIVLDMFFGSGSTGVAAIAEGYHFIGIEQSDTPEEPYCAIARARIAYAMRGEV